MHGAFWLAVMMLCRGLISGLGEINPMTDDLIEKMARAHWESCRPRGYWNLWLDLAQSIRDDQILAMRAAWAVAAEPTEIKSMLMLCDEIGRLAFQMRPPNTVTPQIVQHADTLRRALTKWQAMHGAADVDGER